MKTKNLVLTFLALVTCIGANADLGNNQIVEDLRYDLKNNGVFYNITSNSPKTLEVTFDGFWGDEDNDFDDFCEEKGFLQYSVFDSDHDYYGSYIINVPWTSNPYSTPRYTIGSYAYSGSVVIPSSVTYNEHSYQVTSIGSHAFENCKTVTSVTIPNSVTSIGFVVFYNCSDLTSVKVNCQTPPSVNYPTSRTDVSYIANAKLYVPIGSKAEYEAHAYWTQFKDIIEDIIPFEDSNVEAICLANWDTNGDGVLTPSEAAAVSDLGGVFKNNTEITSFNELQYFTGLTKITSAAFLGCSSLTSINIPNSVTSIDVSAFYGCSALTKAEFSSIEAICGMYFATSSANPLSYTHHLYINGEEVTEVLIPDGVTSINAYAFYGCSGLTSITIPSSVTSISSYAFEGCTGLSSVTIPANVTSIKSWTFRGCTNLKSALIRATELDILSFAESGLETLTIGKEVSKLNGNQGSYGIYPFSTLKQLVIEDGENRLSIEGNRYYKDGADYSPFYGSSLETVYLGRNVDDYRITFGGLFGKTSTFGSETVECNEKLSSLTIGDKVTKIPYEMCLNCIGLTSITIPNSVTSIGRSAFSGCSQLSSITIPNSVVTIGENAFRETAWYNNLSDGMVYAGKVAYNYKGTMPDNMHIDILDGTLGIADGAFYKNTQLSSVIIPNSVTNIGTLAFRSCTGLSSIIIPNSVTNIGNQAFFGCFGLTSIAIPNSLTSIGNYVFRDCTGLTSITIPNSVTSISSDAFSGCNNLTNVTVGWETPLSIYSSTFSNRANATLYVPVGLKAAYQAASYWKEFKEIIEYNYVDGSQDPPVSEFYAALSAITDGWYYLTTDVNGTKFYVTRNGLLTNDKKSAYAFAISKIDASDTGERLFDTAFLIEPGNGGHFSNTNVENNKANLHPGKYSQDRGNNRNNWERQVFFLNETGKIAIRSCNTPYDETSWLDAGRTFWTWEDNGSVIPCYSYEPAYIWTLEEVVDKEGTWVDANGTEWYFTTNGGNATITGRTENNNIIPSVSGTIPVDLTVPAKVYIEEMPYTVNVIGDRAFWNCSNLTSVSIPDGITSIGEQAFYRCTSLNNMTVGATTPPNISDNAFLDSNYKVATLYVPIGSKAAYQAAEGWKNFKEIIEYDPQNTDISQLDNAIYIEPFTAGIGSKVQMDICLKNAEAATAYVFDLVLPEGITVAKNSNGKYMDELSDRHDNYIPIFNYKGENTYGLSTLSGNSEELIGNDGPIRFVTLHVDNAVEEGVYPILIKNASYSKPNGNLVTLADTKSSVTIETIEGYVLGDVNGNGGVDIGDAVSIVSYLVGKESSNFVAEAADTNKNGQIDIGDAVTIVNLLVGKITNFTREFNIICDEKEPE